MIDETLSLARQEVQPLRMRFKIGAYEWCEPDYQQIIAWAKALTLDPEIVIERLLDDRSIRENPTFQSGWEPVLKPGKWSRFIGT